MAKDQPASRWGEFNLVRALFEIVIVAIGVLLALLVDEARQARENRQLAAEAINAMRAELDDNRARFVRKLDLLHRAYRDLDADPSRAAELVADRRNQQVTQSSSAWLMTVETGALRQLKPDERRRYGMAYTAQDTYYDILTREMELWGALAAFDPEDSSPETRRERDQAIRLWKTWANRVGLGVCIAAARIELAERPSLQREKLWAACRSFRVQQPPAELYRRFGLPMPAPRNFL